MKKVFFTAVSIVSVFFAGNANAQKSADVTVNIKLQPIHTILVAGDATVDLLYATEDNYKNGVPVKKDNQLKVFSTGAFVINVKSTVFSNTGGTQSNTIAENHVSVTPSNGTGNSLNWTPQTVALSNTDKIFIESLKGGRDLLFNVEYRGAGSDQFINDYSKYYNAEALNVYTATVTYTILAD